MVLVNMNLDVCLSEFNTDELIEELEQRSISVPWATALGIIKDSYSECTLDYAEKQELIEFAKYVLEEERLTQNALKGA